MPGVRDGSPQEKSPVPGVFEQVPCGSLPASETQPPILSDPRDEPGKCCSKEIFCAGKTAMQATAEHQQFHEDRRESGRREIGLTPLV